MPRVPAQPAKPRKFGRVEFHPEAHKYLEELSDDLGVQMAYIIRCCVQESLPAIEARLRGGEEIPDELKKPSKPLSTRLRKPRPIPDVSRLEAPPISAFLETGEMPQPPVEEPAEPEPSLDPGEGAQVAESPAEPDDDPWGWAPSEGDRPGSDPHPQAEQPAPTKRRRRRG